jgi:hypothetical protein
MAFDPTRRTNAQAIADCVKLGWLRATDAVLDTTYGKGSFWKLWKPADFTGADLDITKSPCGVSVDFRKSIFDDDAFDVVAFDPGYKLSGTHPNTHVLAEMDASYGVVERNWLEVPGRYRDGIPECVRMLKPKGVLLVKTMDGQSLNEYVPLSVLVDNIARANGCYALGNLYVVTTPRKQRTQKTPRNASVLMAFRKSPSRWALSERKAEPPMSIDEALAMEGIGREGDLDATREGLP